MAIRDDDYRSGSSSSILIWVVAVVALIVVGIYALGYTPEPSTTASPPAATAPDPNTQVPAPK
jgi:hypothetical protein